MDPCSFTIILISPIVVFLLRILPRRKKGFVDVDAYYFLLSAEAFKEQHRIPIKLPPYYLLDIEEQ